LLNFCSILYNIIYLQIILTDKSKKYSTIDSRFMKKRCTFGENLKALL
jgi:hypothetical protein